MKVKRKGNYLNGFINIKPGNRCIELNWSVNEWAFPVSITIEKGYFSFRFLCVELIVS